MKIKNINGTKLPACECGNWLQHWVYCSGQTLPAYCPANDCYNEPQVGALVQIDNIYDKSWYVIPLCKEHSNMKGASLNVSEKIKLVSTSIKDTCGKPDFYKNKR